MRSPYNFIIAPYGNERYNNTKEINGVEFIINTSLELAKYVNRLGVVLEIPTYYKGDIQKGDVVIVHHNVFRIYHDMKGRQTNSPEYFRDGVYIVSPSRVYMYRRSEEWIPHSNFCFVKPIENKQEGIMYDLDKEEKHTGILIYPNKELLDKGYSKGDLIAFKKDSEYPFEIDGEKLYRMVTTDILLKLNYES